MESWSLHEKVSQNPWSHRDSVGPIFKTHGVTEKESNFGQFPPGTEVFLGIFLHFHPQQVKFCAKN